MSNATRREQILQAAMELFSGKGYHATSMRDIAERLGMQAGSLYVHISGKEELLYDIVDRAAEEFLRAARLAEDEAGRRNAPAEERLRLTVRAHLEVMAANLDTATVFFHEWKFLDPAHRAEIKGKRDAYEAVFRRIIAEGIEEGAFRRVDSRIAGLAVLSLCNWFYQWYSPQGPLAATEIADRFVDLLLGGLRGAPANAGSGKPAREAVR